MKSSENDKIFSGTIPEIYDTILVPLIFEAYTDEIVKRLRSRAIHKILEVAAGSGVLTRALSNELPDNISLVATDLNEAMLIKAEEIGTKNDVVWQQADAMHLPFQDDTFDAVVCQFGVMFFPDKSVAFSETRRVLKPGGAYIFSVWDKIEENEFADTITTALESLLNLDHPSFLARTPHGYYDLSLIEGDLKKAGFNNSPFIETVSNRSKASSYKFPAIGYCQGTPLKNEIEEIHRSVILATEISATAIGSRFGWGAVDSKIQAHIISIEK